MATNIILTKRGHTLVADEYLSQEIMDRIKDGTQVRAIVTVPRNLKQHRLLFALLNIVCKAQREPRFYATPKDLLDAIKIGTGHVHEVVDLHGNIHFVPSSIDFASMDQVAFSEWFDHAIALILERVLPHCDRPGLEQEIYNTLGERGPDDMR